MTTSAEATACRILLGLRQYYRNAAIYNSPAMSMCQLYLHGARFSMRTETVFRSVLESESESKLQLESESKAG